MIPMCCLQNSIPPKLLPKHFLKKGNHGSQGVSHPVVRLLEGYYEDMHKLNFISKGGHQVFYSFLFFHQGISKPRSVNDGDHLCGVVPQPVPLVSTCILGNAVKAGADSKATTSKSAPVVVLISSK